MRLEFILFKDSALLKVYLDDKIILKQNIEVYDKETFDIDLVIDVFK